MLILLKMALLSNSRELRFKKAHTPPETGVLVGFVCFVICMIIFYIYILPER